jgi:anaerobic magnesium-protoporphyrin IX monomethyl ester cyclase
MMGSRGCPFQCRFCSNPQMWTTRFYMRSPKDIVDEMEAYEQRYGVTEFQFQDLTFVLNKKWVIKVADEIIERGRDYVWKLPSGTRSEAFDMDLLSKMSKSGCTSLTLAPETGSARMSKMINKPVDLDRFVEIGRSVRSEGIDMTLNFYMLFGVPDEKLSDVLASFRFLVRMAIAGFNSVGLNKFMTYPGSAYHDEFMKRGVLTYGDDYFLGLRLDARYQSYNEGVEFEPPWSLNQLQSIIVSGYLLFYSTYYLSHPSRIMKSIKSMWRSQPTTRLEAILSQALIQPLRQRLFGTS